MCAPLIGMSSNPMNPGTTPRLHSIHTRWTLVARAGDDGTVANRARHDLVERYSGAAWRYMLALTKNENDAEELFQEFALRLLRGDLRRADPSRGRFRDYLKAVLVNLVRDRYRQRSPVALPDQLADNRSEFNPDADLESVFLNSWRRELLQLTWTRLRHQHPKSHAVLMIHVESPEALAAEKAAYLAHQTGRPCTANHYRVSLHRARGQFATILRKEVATSLNHPSTEQVDRELKSLRLLRYCGPV